MLWFNESCERYVEEWTDQQHRQSRPPPPPNPDRVVVIEDELVELPRPLSA